MKNRVESRTLLSIRNFPTYLKLVPSKLNILAPLCQLNEKGEEKKCITIIKSLRIFLKAIVISYSNDDDKSWIES